MQISQISGLDCLVLQPGAFAIGCLIMILGIFGTGTAGIFEVY